MATPQAPEVQRLLNEVIRVCKVPLSRTFDDPKHNGRLWLALVADAVMGENPYVSLRAAKNRAIVKATEEGFIVKGDQGDKFHDHESAAEFGFLERQRSYYSPGKYLKIYRCLFKEAGSISPKILRSIFLHSLLTRAGDCVLPVLSLINEHGTVRQEEFEAGIVSGIRYKRDVADSKSLRSSRAVYEYKKLLHDWDFKWSELTATTGTSGVGAVGGRRYTPRPYTDEKPYDIKTRAGYRQRTVSSLKQLEVIEQIETGKFRLTETGDRLYQALVSQGWITSSVQTIGPSIEAATDGLSLPIQRYLDIYSRASSSASQFESVVAETIIGTSAPEPWRDHELEISCSTRNFILQMGDPNTSYAQIDDVRLAVFLHCLNKGHYVSLETDNFDTPGYSLNNNAIATIAKERPGDFGTGKARGSSRLWSVGLKRK